MFHSFVQSGLNDFIHNMFGQPHVQRELVLHRRGQVPLILAPSSSSLNRQGLCTRKESAYCFLVMNPRLLVPSHYRIQLHNNRAQQEGSGLTDGNTQSSQKNSPHSPVTVLGWFLERLDISHINTKIMAYEHN